MKKIITILALFTSMMSFAQTKVENVDASTFKKMIDEKKSYLIDLRTDDELKNKGFIKGAAQIDFLSKDAEAVIAKLDKKKTYLVYCAGGGRSGELGHRTGMQTVRCRVRQCAAPLGSAGQCCGIFGMPEAG